MKKLVLFIAVIVAVSFASCKKAAVAPEATAADSTTVVEEVPAADERQLRRVEPDSGEGGDGADGTARTGVAAASGPALGSEPEKDRTGIAGGGACGLASR